MMSGNAMQDRYAGISEWYEAFAADSAARGRADIVALLGPGDGFCVDVGCGTGIYFDAIRATGRSPIGVDFSADQLAVARSRGDRLVRADARWLPFRDESVDCVTALWVSSDVAPFGMVLGESTRVLVPGGRLLLYGVHPCFNGPLVQNLEDGSRRVYPGYRRSERYESAPWWSPGGIRHRVGMVHVPLSELLQAVIDAPLRIERVVEPRDDPVPFILAVVASKS